MGYVRGDRAKKVNICTAERPHLFAAPKCVEAQRIALFEQSANKVMGF